MKKLVICKQTFSMSYMGLVERLTDLGYDTVPMATSPGDMSKRGAIIDVFGYNHSHPTRMEFFGDAIDRMTSFDPYTQRSISMLDEVTFSVKPKATSGLFYTVQQETVDTDLIGRFQADDYVVHEQFGIGQYKGLVRLRYTDKEGEFALLQYRGKDKLYVPLDQLSLLHLYSGQSDPTLNRLHDSGWKTTKKKAEKSIKHLAEEIYLLHQVRQSQRGYACQEDTEAQLLMENEFKFTLTPDQDQAIQTVKYHMEQPHPMDVLLCGDVGFGKTEVMLRAAFKALENLKQVAVLVPTTILCAQHVKTFSERLEKYGYIVKGLSRFYSTEERQQTIQQLKKQQVDVVISTHQLLSESVMFKDLGLLIVDEEQRFGVSHKELIKQRYQMVDVITVSATPIPRTLYMSLTGAKTCALIQTPPKNRTPIKTYVGRYEDNLVQQAVRTEMNRYGQVYYLFNNVRRMKKKLRELQGLLPSCRIEMAHGQMDQSTLQSVMMDFYQRQIDVLLCSTIIENGMDIVTANTIIIENADQLGLAQIHQIRGRVGRSETQGYAYLLYQDALRVSPQGQRRLQAIKEYASLGSGYQLSKKDLEIRGAGQLFGREQSGHIADIGFTLYTKLLEESIYYVQGKTPPKRTEVPINAQKIVLSEAYIPDPRERLALYMRLLEVQSVQSLDTIRQELVDRYGALDEPTQKVFEYLNKQIQIATR